MQRAFRDSGATLVDSRDLRGGHDARCILGRAVFSDKTTKASGIAEAMGRKIDDDVKIVE